MSSPTTGQTPSNLPPLNSPSLQSVPPLEQGDRLTRDEFERRYDAHPNVPKAELIEGVVHMPSPVRFRRHGNPHARLIGWLFHYEAATPGVLTGDNSTARLDLDNEPQPDAVLLIDPDFGGQATISSDDYVENAPELVGEISSSSVSIDLNTKLGVYRRSGVREYIAWRVTDEVIDWFELSSGKYERMEPNEAGVLCSETFPGLWLNVVALLAGDLAAVLRTLDEGLASPPHAEFVERIRSYPPKP